MMTKRWLLILSVLSFSVGIGISALPPPSVEQVAFHCQIEGPHQVYDGDTLRGIRINLVETTDVRNCEVFPGIFVEGGSVYVRTNLRIFGIDTPEKRPRKYNRDGTPRTELERERERQAAEKARQALVGLLEGNDWRFMVINPRLGKYASRIVAKVLVGDVDVSQYLLHRQLAVPYTGGTKPVWTWGAQ